MLSSVQFADATAMVSEIGAAIALRVTNTGDVTQAVSVQFATGGDSAGVGDYIGTTGTLNFSAGQNEATITVAVVDNSTIEPNESFQVTLSNPSAFASLGSPATITVTIVDDDNLAVANLASVPGEGFNSLKFRPDGQLSQLLWISQNLVYRVRDAFGNWSHERVTGDIIGGDNFGGFSTEPYRDFEQAQLLFEKGGTPHVLLLAGQGILHYRRGASGWQQIETIPPPGSVGLFQIDNLAAEIGTDNSLHFIITQYVSEGSAVHANLLYATNKTGARVFQTVATLGLPRSFNKTAYAPRFVSLALDSQNFAHCSFTADFVNQVGVPPLSQLSYATNRSGAWVTQIVSQPADSSGDAGLGASVAIGPGDVAAVASFLVERAETGVAQSSRLLLHTRQSNGTFLTETVATTPAGYVAGDGALFTGFAPFLQFDHVGRPNITFSDHASQQFPAAGPEEYAGQIRHAIKYGGTWSISTIFQQTDPTHNQIIYPAAALSTFENVFAGQRRVDTVNPDGTVVSSNYFIEMVSRSVTSTRPDLRVFYNENYYLSHNPDVKAAVFNGVFLTGFDHFAPSGQRERRAFSQYFSENYYRSKNPDVASVVDAGVLPSGYEHFVASGQIEGRRFNPLWHDAAYRAMYTDVGGAVAAGAFKSGFEHFSLIGEREGRLINWFYKEEFYLAKNPDVAGAVAAGAFASGWEHFAASGQTEQRLFSPIFDERIYRAENSDVVGAIGAGVFASGIDHFIRSGRLENRRIRPLYDEAFYLLKNPDVAAAVSAGIFPNGFVHFMAVGKNEARRFCPHFDEQFYLNQYPDVKAAVQANVLRSGYDHFVFNGQFEGRMSIAPA